jgi:hypothetical protein
VSATSPCERMVSTVSRIERAGRCCRIRRQTEPRTTYHTPHGDRARRKQRPGSFTQHRGPATLRRETIPIAPPAPDEVLVEPIYRSWEADMTGAIERQPIDVCRRRG